MKGLRTHSNATRSISRTGRGGGVNHAQTCMLHLHSSIARNAKNSHIWYLLLTVYDIRVCFFFMFTNWTGTEQDVNSYSWLPVEKQNSGGGRGLTQPCRLCCRRSHQQRSVAVYGIISISSNECSRVCFILAGVGRGANLQVPHDNGHASCAVCDPPARLYPLS